MPRRIFLTILFGLSGATLGGCGWQSGGRLYESDQWRTKGGSLGTVALIVTGDIRQFPEDRRGPDATAASVARAAKAALEQLPDTTVLGDVASVTMAADLNDRDAIARAKAQGAQSVCVVTVGLSGGRFTIGFAPPALPDWTCDSFFLYSLRLLDVETGDLLAHCVTYRQDGGPYAICKWDDSLKALQHDLRAPHALAATAASHPTTP